jgi:hypothetical protein
METAKGRTVTGRLYAAEPVRRCINVSTATKAQSGRQPDRGKPTPPIKEAE